MAQEKLGVSCELIDLQTILPWDTETVCKVTETQAYDVKHSSLSKDASQFSFSADKLFHRGISFCCLLNQCSKNILSLFSSLATDSQPCSASLSDYATIDHLDHHLA